MFQFWCKLLKIWCSFFFLHDFTAKKCKLIPRFTSMGNNLISKKLLEGKLFLFCSPQRRKEYEMKWIEMKCLLLRLRSLNTRGASRHPAFMGNCQTISHTCQPYLPSRWVLLYIFVPGVTKGYESVQYFIVVWCK